LEEKHDFFPAVGPIEDGPSVSVASNLFELDDHSVKLLIHIENHTDQELELVEHFKLPGSEGEWGVLGGTNMGGVFPKSILPGKRESSFGRKTSDTATGCAGTVSWKIDDDYCAVVMFSLPYNFDFYSNWLSVGIMKKREVEYKGGNGLFDHMYNDEEDRFKRGQFYHHENPIEYKRGSYKIVGEMGKTHEAEIKIQIFAEQKEKALKQTKANEGTETEAEAKPLVEVGVKALTETDAEAKALAEAGAKALTETEAEAKAFAEAGPKALTETEAEAKALAEAGPKALTETEAEAKAPAEAGAKSWFSWS
jgi:hypothetical protein